MEEGRMGREMKSRWTNKGVEKVIRENGGKEIEA
jgi:hypothetical protein